MLTPTIKERLQLFEMPVKILFSNYICGGHYLAKPTVAQRIESKAPKSNRVSSSPMWQKSPICVTPFCLVKKNFFFNWKLVLTCKGFVVLTFWRIRLSLSAQVTSSRLVCEFEPSIRAQHCQCCLGFRVSHSLPLPHYAHAHSQNEDFDKSTWTKAESPIVLGSRGPETFKFNTWPLYNIHIVSTTQLFKKLTLCVFNHNIKLTIERTMDWISIFSIWIYHFHIIESSLYMLFIWYYIAM